VARVKAWREQYPGAKEKTQAANRKYAATEKGKAARQAHQESEQRRQQLAAWKASDAGKEAQRRANQSDAGKARSARYFSSEKGKAAIRRKQKTDLGKANAARSRHKRRMLLASELSTLTAAEWAQIQTDQGGRCLYCGQIVKLTMDHVIPLSRGGEHTKENVVGACRSCNSAKKDRPLEEWRPG